MGFRNTQNRWFVRCHFDNGEVRWEIENNKKLHCSSAHTAAMLRFAADMIDYFDRRLDTLPEEPRAVDAVVTGSL